VLTRWLAQKRRLSRVGDGDGWYLGEDERHRFLDEEAASRVYSARERDVAVAAQTGSTRGRLGFLERLWTKSRGRQVEGRRRRQGRWSHGGEERRLLYET
jgi:ribosomal protein L34